MAVLAVAAYVFLNATWAANPGGALGRASLLLSMSLMVFAATGALAELDQAQLRRVALAFTAGAFLGGLFLLFEMLTDAALTRMAMNAVA